MAKASQQGALLRYLQGDEDEPIAQPYGQPGAGTLPAINGRSAQTYGKPGNVTQLPSNSGAITDTVGSAGMGVAQSLAGAGAGAALGGVSLATDYLGGKLKPKEEMPTYGGEHGAITDSYGRRFEGAGPGVAGGAVRGAGYGAMLGPVGAGIGAGIGALVGGITKNAPSAFSDFKKEDAADALTKGYQTYLGRDPEPGAVDGRLAGQGLKPGDRWVGEKNLFDQLSQIKNSEEAQTRASGGGVADALSGMLGTMREPDAAGNGFWNPRAPKLNPQTGEYETPTGPLIATTDGSPAPTGGAAPSTGAGGLGQYADALGGFDPEKFDGVDESPKYLVGRVLSKYPPTPEGLRQALPELQAMSEQYGLGNITITGSKGDKLSFGGATNPKFQGITEFDVIKAAGLGGQGWQWLDPNAAGGGAASSGAAPASTGAASPTLDGLGSGSLEAIMAALSQIAQGPNDPKTLQASLLRKLTNAGA